MTTTRNPQTLMAISPEENFDFLFKIVLIGDAGTGKTCVVSRFKNGKYEESHGSTIGVDFSLKTVNIEGKQVKVCLLLQLHCNALHFIALFLLFHFEF